MKEPLYQVRAYYRGKISKELVYPQTMEDCLAYIEADLLKHSFSGWKYKIVEV